MSERRRAIVAVTAAGAVVVAAVAVILAFGLIPVPEYPSLADHPDPSIPGTIAYVTYGERRDQPGPCLSVVPASGGESRTVYCDGFDAPGGPMWTADGRIVVFRYPSTYLVIDPESEPVAILHVSGDPATFEEVPVRMFDRTQTREDGATVSVRSNWDGDNVTSLIVRFPDGTTRTLLQPERAPADYRFDWAMWSPDGNWILVTDSDGRLIIVDARGGDPNPRVLVDLETVYGSNASWYIPGYDRYTIELPGQ